MLSELNQCCERFEAIQPTINEIKHGLYKQYYQKACDRFKSYVDNQNTHRRAIGVFGAYLSHLEIHRSQINNPKPYMILEDDAKIEAETFTELREMIENSYFEDWDIIRSTWNARQKVFKFRRVHRESKFRRAFGNHNYFGGAHFSVFKDAKKIVNYLEEENMMAIDSAYSTCKLNVYCKKLGVEALEEEFGTDIPKE